MWNWILKEKHNREKQEDDDDDDDDENKRKYNENYSWNEIGSVLVLYRNIWTHTPNRI